MNKTPFARVPGLIVLFGSGEMSPTGRKIHETVIRQAGFTAPVRIGILETPSGFEVNAIHGWPERMEKFFNKSLKNFHPSITRIRALRRDGELSTNNPAIIEAILYQDYLYCGAGSPGYAVKHLKNSLAFDYLLKAHEDGKVLCFGSATAVAVSRWSIPVYEIFKVGEDLHWTPGLNFFKQLNPNLVIVPHWNNREGEDFDTTRCWLGSSKFKKMRTLLPQGAVILGIEEQTACVIDESDQTISVLGTGNTYILKGFDEKQFASGERFSFDWLRDRAA